MSSVVVGPPAGGTAASVARKSAPLEAAAEVVLSLTAAVLSLVVVPAALRPVVAGSGIRSLDPAGTVVGVSSAPVAACAAEVIPCLVPGSCRVPITHLPADPMYRLTQGGNGRVVLWGGGEP